MPRFDMRDKDGIIFDPIAPRAGEKLVAKCTLVGLTPNDKRHVSKCREKKQRFLAVIFYASSFHVMKPEGRMLDLLSFLQI